MSSKIPFLLDFLNVIQEVDKDIPITYIKCIACIGMQNGIRPSDLSLNSGIEISTLSRILQALERNLGLIVVQSVPENKREKALYLTVKGKIFLERMLQLLK